MPQPDRPKGRPLDEGLTGKILDAALRLTAEKGFRDMRLSDVAAEVGTSKQALYRRWPTKSHLIADAIRTALATANPEPPDTGNIAGDLASVLENTFRLVGGTPFGGAIRTLVAETGDEILSGLLREIEEDRRWILRAIFTRARERGEIDRTRDVELDIDMLLGLAYHRLLVRRVEIKPGLATDLVTQWSRGI